MGRLSRGRGEVNPACRTQRRTAVGWGCISELAPLANVAAVADPGPASARPAKWRQLGDAPAGGVPLWQWAVARAAGKRGVQSLTLCRRPSPGVGRASSPLGREPARAPVRREDREARFGGRRKGSVMESMSGRAGENDAKAMSKSDGDARIPNEAQPKTAVYGPQTTDFNELPHCRGWWSVARGTLSVVRSGPPFRPQALFSAQSLGRKSGKSRKVGIGGSDAPRRDLELKESGRSAPLVRLVAIPLESSRRGRSKRRKRHRSSSVLVFQLGLVASA